MTTYARAFKLTFEMPKPDSDTVIRTEIHYVTENDQGDVTFISGTKEELFKLLSEIALDTITITDPVTQETKTLSIAGIAQAITQIVVNWLSEEAPGFVDNNGRYVIEE
jgi:hypothetical protein